MTGRSQAVVAGLCGVTERYLSLIENGHRTRPLTFWCVWRGNWRYPWLPSCPTRCRGVARQP
ncbi:hypothetical protein ACIPV8_27735 [Streptomyces albidoflavus]